jgi:hypothetical protein
MGWCNGLGAERQGSFPAVVADLPHCELLLLQFLCCAALWQQQAGAPVRNTQQL